MLISATRRTLQGKASVRISWTCFSIQQRHSIKVLLVNLDKWQMFTYTSFRNEEIQTTDRSCEGKSWTDGIYSPYSWREKTRAGIFLTDVPLVVSLTHCKTLDRRTHPVSHIVYQVSKKNFTKKKPKIFLIADEWPQRKNFFWQFLS